MLFDFPEQLFSLDMSKGSRYPDVSYGLFNSAIYTFLEYPTAIVTEYPFAISAWFWTSTAANQVLFSLSDKDTNDQYFRVVMVSDGDVVVQVANVSAETAEVSDNYADGSWHHLYGLWTATSQFIRLDDTTEDTNAAAVSWPAVDRTSIGRFGRLATQDYWNGGIDNVAIFNADLTTAERTWMAASHRTYDELVNSGGDNPGLTNLVGHYSMDTNNPKGFGTDDVGNLHLNAYGVLGSQL